MNYNEVLELAGKKGYRTTSEIKASLKWEMERVRQVLEHLLKEGLAWLDWLGSRADLPLGARSPL